jgi:hypothetical protein
MANNSDAETLELTLRTARSTSGNRASTSGNRASELPGVKSQAVLRKSKDGGIAKHGALLVTLGGGIGYFVGVRSLSGFATELGISISDLGIDFRDYVLFALLSSLAIVAGLGGFYAGRWIINALVQAIDPAAKEGGPDVKRERNKWRPAIAAGLVGFLWIITRPNDLEPDFSGSGLYWISVITTGFFAGFLIAALFSAWSALGEELDARGEDNRNRVARSLPPKSRMDWWVGVVTLGVLCLYPVSLFVVSDLASPLSYGLFDWPTDYAHELRDWSHGDSSYAPTEPDTLGVIMKPILVAFELDGRPQCGIRVSKNVVLQDGETIIIPEPESFRVGACSSDGEDFVLRPGR